MTDLLQYSDCIDRWLDLTSTFEVPHRNILGNGTSPYKEGGGGVLLWCSYDWILRGCYIGVVCAQVEVSPCGGVSKVCPCGGVFKEDMPICSCTHVGGCAHRRCTHVGVYSKKVCPFEVYPCGWVCPCGGVFKEGMFVVAVGYLHIFFCSNFKSRYIIMTMSLAWKVIGGEVRSWGKKGFVMRVADTPPPIAGAILIIVSELISAWIDMAVDKATMQSTTYVYRHFEEVVDCQL